ncbi:MAG TPA: glycosyl transferase family 1, partial [Candidatus Hydrogenedentes bacterium]|nr:glycosyl transferase family 1 [Candidatus Hydrogenedentota bacterium]
DAGYIPEIKMTHLKTLTDNTGILQHALFAVPNRHHGYCTDDNARALIAALMYYDLYRDETALPLISTYLSFVHYAYDQGAGRFRNMMGYDRHWLEETGSEDAHGRALWALGIASALAPNESVVSFAVRLFSRALGATESFTSPRAWAFALIGMGAYLVRYDGDTQVRRFRALLAERLYELFKANAAPEWPWCEDIISYGNALMPHALILSGQWIPDGDMVQQGLTSLEWLYNQQVNDEGTISLIGNRGWMERNGERARFAQQPVDAMALVGACAEAFRCTQEPVWRERAQRCFQWFLGGNDMQSVIYDYQTGGCRDGLEPDGPNLNQGAESTLAWLIAAMTMQDLARSAVVVEVSKKRLAEKAQTPVSN